jgi:hypothetical protein
MAKWLITEVADGNFALSVGRKAPVAYGSTLRRLQSFAEQQMEEGDSLILVEQDGYRTRLKGKRRGWRTD